MCSSCSMGPIGMQNVFQLTYMLKSRKGSKECHKKASSQSLMPFHPHYVDPVNWHMSTLSKLYTEILDKLCKTIIRIEPSPTRIPNYYSQLDRRRLSGARHAKMFTCLTSQRVTCQSSESSKYGNCSNMSDMCTYSRRFAWDWSNFL